MQMSGNTILITGGGTGIGRGLAEAFHKQGNQVVIAGRTAQTLDETTAANSGMRSVIFDIEDTVAMPAFTAKLAQDFPELNVVIHNAGIMRMEDVKNDKIEDAEQTIGINLLGPIRLTAALMPHLLAQPKGAILTLTSGLAYAPLAMNPTYCATKAAIHSWTQSLRYRLQDTGVQVIELIPPYVRTGLTGEEQAKDPNAMPLDEYIGETMRLLAESPDAGEIVVEKVKAQRFAERSGHYDEFFKQFNDRMFEVRKERWEKFTS